MPLLFEESKPRETVVISVSPEDVLVQGKMVARVDDVLAGEPAILDPLAVRLAELKENIIGQNTQTVAESQEVTILADKSVPFVVVRMTVSPPPAVPYATPRPRSNGGAPALADGHGPGGGHLV